MVRGQERRPHPHIPKERLCPWQEPRVQGRQKEHFGQQGQQEHGEVEPCQQVYFFNSINCELHDFSVFCDFKLLHLESEGVKERLKNI